MNILIITPRIPYPPFRGDKLKIYNIAKILSRNNSVRILTFRRNNKHKEYLKNFESLGINLETVRLSFLESIFWIFTAFFTKLPFQAALYKSMKMKKRIDELSSNGNFDVIYVHWIRIAQYFNSIINNNNSINVIDYTDAVSLNLSRLLNVEKNPIRKLILNIERKKIIEHERLAEKYHTLFICSELDKNFLAERGIEANYKLLYNGIDTDYFQPISTKFDLNRIIFTGNMSYRANYDAVLYFVNEIFPIIKKSIPEAKFFIVGQNPPKKIIKLESPDIFITGFVKDIKAEYLKSAVNIAPTRFGAGTLNKVLESIALGIPVVATSIAIGGLPKELVKYVFIADNPTEFTIKVLEVIKNPKIREELMVEGANVIRNMLSWDKIVGDFENYLVDELKKNLNK